MEITLYTQYSLFAPDKYDEPNISSNELAEKYSEYFSRYGYIPNHPDLAKDKNKVTFRNFRLYINLEAASRAEKDYIKVLNYLSNQDYIGAKQLLLDIRALCPQYIAAIRTLAKMELSEGNIEDAFDYCIEGLNIYDRDIELLNIMSLIFNAKGMVDASQGIRQTIINISPDYDFKEEINIVSICEEPSPLFSNIVRIENKPSDAYYLSKALYRAGGKDDIKFAYEIMEGWLAQAGLNKTFTIHCTIFVFSLADLACVSLADRA